MNDKTQRLEVIQLTIKAHWLHFVASCLTISFAVSIIAEFCLMAAGVFNRMFGVSLVIAALTMLVRHAEVWHLNKIIARQRQSDGADQGLGDSNG